jgi:hypothetical protein
VDAIERIYSVESCEGSRDDSFLTEFGEDVGLIGMESIDTQGSDPLMSECFKYSSVVISEDRLESSCEEFWEFHFGMIMY